MTSKSKCMLLPAALLSLGFLAACDRNVDSTTAETDLPATAAQDSVTPNPAGSTTSTSPDPYTSATAPTDVTSTPSMDDAQQTDAPMSNDPANPANPANQGRDPDRAGEPPMTSEDNARTGGDATDDNMERPANPQP